MLLVIIFYHFIFSKENVSKRFYARCEGGVTIGMQDKDWMTAHFFKAWIDYFVKHVKTCNGISPLNHHLLILNGHASHVTIDIVKKAWLVGIGLLTFPSHTSHVMQRFDMNCFKLLIFLLYCIMMFGL